MVDFVRRVSEQQEEGGGKEEEGGGQQGVEGGWRWEEVVARLWERKVLEWMGQREAAGARSRRTTTVDAQGPRRMEEEDEEEEKGAAADKSLAAAVEEEAAAVGHDGSTAVGEEVEEEEDAVAEGCEVDVLGAVHNHRPGAVLSTAIEVKKRREPPTRTCRPSRAHTRSPTWLLLPCPHWVWGLAASLSPPACLSLPSGPAGVGSGRASHHHQCSQARSSTARRPLVPPPHHQHRA